MEGSDQKKFLKTVVSIMALVGFIFASFPFFASFFPSAKTQRLWVEIDTSEVAEGGQKIFEWRGQPVLYRKLSQETKNQLISLNDLAQGEDYTVDSVPDFVMLVMLSTAKGCKVRETQYEDMKSIKYKGYIDPCHRGFWDYSGRLLPFVYGGEGLADMTKFKNYKWVSKLVIRVPGDSN